MNSDLLSTFTHTHARAHNVLCTVYAGKFVCIHVYAYVRLFLSHCVSCSMIVCIVDCLGMCALMCVLVLFTQVKLGAHTPIHSRNMLLTFSTFLYTRKCQSNCEFAVQFQNEFHFISLMLLFATRCVNVCLMLVDFNNNKESYHFPRRQ